MMIYTTGPYVERMTARVTPQGGLILETDEKHGTHICGLPDGVAEATASAFNAAMARASEAKKETAQ